MVASLVVRAIAAAAKPVARLGGNAIRAVFRRPVTTAASAAAGAVVTGNVDNPIPEIVDDVEAGAVSFTVGAGMIVGGYLVYRRIKKKKKK